MFAASWRNLPSRRWAPVLVEELTAGGGVGGVGGPLPGLYLRDVAAPLPLDEVVGADGIGPGLAIDLQLRGQLGLLVQEPVVAGAALARPLDEGSRFKVKGPDDLNVSQHPAFASLQLEQARSIQPIHSQFQN